MKEQAKGIDNINIGANCGIIEYAKWKPHWKIEKYHGDVVSPENLFETDEFDGNILLNEGITALLTLLIGGGGTAFNAANAYIGVGDSVTAAAASQTGLQASTNKAYVVMDGTYPQVLNQTVTFRATFGSAVGNFAWQEFSIANGNSDAATNLSRKVESHSTKVAGDTFVVSCTVTIS